MCSGSKLMEIQALHHELKTKNKEYMERYVYLGEGDQNDMNLIHSAVLCIASGFLFVLCA